ncbi:MAG: hypothetical protein OXB98_22360 [Bryobacterales bacterium]|nr:hypothetical protein [Bryobacterales bacterium]
MEETDITEIRADPMAMQSGTFEGVITITEQQPAGIPSLSSDRTPGWPVTIPVTLIVIKDYGLRRQQTVSSFTGRGPPEAEARLYSVE